MKMLQRFKRKMSQLSTLIKKPIIRLSPCQLESLSSSAPKELHHIQNCSNSKQRSSLFIWTSVLRGLWDKEGPSLDPIPINGFHQSFPPPILVGVMKAYSLQKSEFLLMLEYICLSQFHELHFTRASSRNLSEEHLK